MNVEALKLLETAKNSKNPPEVRIDAIVKIIELALEEDGETRD